MNFQNTILGRIADYHKDNLNLLRPLNGDPWLYAIPTAFLELASNLFQGLTVNMPTGSNKIVDRYIVFDPQIIIGLDRSTPYSFTHFVEGGKELSLGRLNRLHTASSKSFIEQFMMQALGDRRIQIAVDVSMYDEHGTIESLMLDINTHSFEMGCNTFSVSKCKSIDRVRSDFKRMAHASPIVINVLTVQRLLHDRLNCMRDIGSPKLLYIEKVVADIQHTSNADSAEYVYGSKSVREFDIKVPIVSYMPETAETKLLGTGLRLVGLAPAKVYLNRASKFGTLAITVYNPDVVVVLNRNFVLENCVSVTEISDDAEIAVRVMDKVKFNDTESKFVSNRVITVTFPIDGWESPSKGD